MSRYRYFVPPGGKPKSKRSSEGFMPVLYRSAPSKWFALNPPSTAARHGVAVTIDCGIPGALTRPVRAALGLCEWIESNYPAVRLARLLEAGVLEPVGDTDLSGSAAARLLRQCSVRFRQECVRRS